MKEFYIGNKKIGGDTPCFIIAELSANHGGEIDIAIKSIREAKKTGADAIKLQTFTPDTITIDSKRPEFLINHGTMWDGRYLYDLYQETFLPREWHKKLFEVAKEEGLICFSSPFDLTAVSYSYTGLGVERTFHYNECYFADSCNSNITVKVA